jgi:hypothetical protein
LTGKYPIQRFEIEPSVRLYALWEHESQFVDSLGTLQGENNFSGGRASGGVRVAYPWLWSTMAVTPYVGLYSDYYFSGANAPLFNSATPLLLPTQVMQGWSARVMTGFSLNFAGGARMSLGSELGGLGSQNFTTWTFLGRGGVPFSPQ